MTKAHAWSKIGIFLLTIPMALFAHGLVIQQWWQWFIVPHGIGAITLAQAIVLRFAAALLTVKRDTREADKEDLAVFIARLFAWAIIAPVVFYLLGWAFKAWMPL